jgi:5-methyltetrahydropteroyltriglutamate--homocysteine methyltransferase
MASHDFAEAGDLTGWPKDKDLGVGVIDIENLQVESPEKIADGSGRQSRFPAEQVCVSTDCALASLHRVVAKKKLQALVRGTEIIRGELSGTH